MTARSVYEAAVKAAHAAKVITNNANLTAAQATYNASGVDAGNNPSRGSSAAVITATINANAAYAAAQLLAEMTKQVAIQSAKDVLRNSGDNAPA